MRRFYWWLPIALFATGCIATGVLAQTARPPAIEVTELEVGKPVERQLAGGQSHEYHFTLQAAEYARISADPRTVRVTVTLFGPDGKQLIESPGFLSSQIIELIGETSGVHRILVKASEPTAPVGRYGITIRQIEAATDTHKRRVAGVRALSEGMAFWVQRPRPALLQAVERFEEALTHWRAVNDLAFEASTLYDIGLAYAQNGNQAKALEYTSQALPIAQASKDRLTEAWALDSLGTVHNTFGDRQKAVEFFDQALPMMRAVGNREGEANTLNNLGIAYSRMGEMRKALDYFDQSVQVYSEIQDRGRLATLNNNIGLTHGELGDYQRALDNYQRALALHRELGSRVGEAITLNNIGAVYSSLANYQKGLDAYRAALEIHRSLDGRWDTAINLHNIAWVYSNLGDRQRALNFYEEALAILREVKDQFSLANTVSNLGATYAEEGNYAKALEFHNEALALRRAVRDRDGEALSLSNIGNTYAKLSDREKARDHYERAIELLRTSGNLRRLAGALKNLGALHREFRNPQLAQASLEEALRINRTLQDRRGESDVLIELARLERDRDDLNKAHQRASEAVTALESLRLTVASPTLRASFFASARGVQELDIAVLMRLHVQQPGAGYAAEALLASERGRARSLLELLGESNTEIRRGVDSALLDRERELEQLISGKAEQQIRLLNRQHTEAAAATASKELDTLTAELEQIQSRIRESSPQYAALTQPVPLNLQDIQSKVLDEDTVLLEYALGAEKSFLWAVTPASLDVYELPPRAEVESVAKGVYELLTARNQKAPKETAAARSARLRQNDADYPAAAAKASKMLLGPAASRIQNKRLLIVGEGVLQYLPFSALPEPLQDGTEPVGQPPLILSHEIVTAPSASVVAVLRQEMRGRKPAEKGLAVIADPVFTADDPRIASQKTSIAAAPGKAAAAPDKAEDGAPGGEAIRSAADVGVDFVRLRFSRSEAEEITRLARAAGTLKALDFEASRETVLNPDFGRYRIVHFATHSLLNNQRPELSGVVLSLVDRAGRPQNGFLRLYDIYNLRLGSDLVVLSACQTALGGEIKGEGLIGLTRGFLYAGAPRVVATLWAIDDRTTAELMKKFYEGMLVRGERPAAALRAAQVATWKTRGWDAPYYWAAFTLQGEWW